MNKPSTFIIHLRLGSFKHDYSCLHGMRHVVMVYGVEAFFQDGCIAYLLMYLGQG